MLWRIPTLRRVAARSYLELNNWSAGALCEVGLADDYRNQK